MIKRITGLLAVILLTVSCGFVNNVTTGISTSPTLVTPSIASNTSSVSNSTEVSTSTATDTPAVTPTSSVPSGAVVVDTFDQEVYPFKQNGNCSLGEAIWAVQTQKNQDGCVVTAGNNTIYLPCAPLSGDELVSGSVNI